MSILLYALIPVATTLLGALVAAVRPPGRSLRSAIQHFAAGVVFSVVAVELLPDITRVHDLFEVGWTFAAGVLVMLGIERLGRKLGGEGAGDAERGAGGLGAGQAIAIGIDILLDGLLVGIAFAAGAKEGRLLVLALSLELLSLGLSVASTLVGRGAGRVRTVVVPTALASLLLVGAVAGETVLANASEHTLAGVLSFGCAALLYLVTEELLVEAHETADTTFATSMFFAGFLLFMLLGMLE